MSDVGHTTTPPDRNVRNPSLIPARQREVTATMTESYVYDAARVNEVYAALRSMGFKCVMEFADYDDDARAQELFEALHDSQLFHELFYGIRDMDIGLDFSEHDPDA